MSKTWEEKKVENEKVFKYVKDYVATWPKWMRDLCKDVDCVEGPLTASGKDLEQELLAVRLEKKILEETKKKLYDKIDDLCSEIYGYPKTLPQPQEEIDFLTEEILFLKSENSELEEKVLALQKKLNEVKSS